MRYGLALARMVALALVFLSFVLALGLIAPCGRRLRFPSWNADAMILAHVRSMCRVMGFHIHWHGPKPGDGPFLLLSNHVSYLDVIALGSLWPMAFMAKAVIARWPVIGFLARRGATVFVERDNVSQKVRALYQAKKILKSRSFCIFPEATTTALHQPSEAGWNRGNIYLARHATSEVYTLGLHYEDHESLAWIDEQALLPHLFRNLQRLTVHLHIESRRLDDDPQLSLADVSRLSHQRIAQLSSAACRRAPTRAGGHAVGLEA